MKFRNSSSPAPFLNRRDQYRLLTLVAMLSMVMIAAHAAKNPANWYWLTGPPAKHESEKPTRDSHMGSDRPAAAGREASAPLADDEFFSPLRPDEADSRPAAKTAAVPRDDGDNETVEATPHRRTKNRGETAVTAHGDVVSPLEPGLLQPIKDNTIVIQQQEAEAYYEVFRRLETYTDSAMEQAAEKGFTFPVIMAQPDLLRGRVLTVEGELQRLTMLAPQPAAEDVGTLYEAWLFTRESRNNPIRVVCLNPGGFPEAEQFSPRPRVKFSGYFFKLYGYVTQHAEIHKAPLFLARRVQKVSGGAADTHDPGMGRYVFAVLAVFGLAFVAMVIRFTLSDRGPRRRHRENLVAAHRDEIEALKNIETFDVSDMLKRLSDDEDAAMEATSKP